MITRSNILLILMVPVVATAAAFGFIEPPEPCPGANPGFVQINITHNSTTTSAPSIKTARANDILKFKRLGLPNKNLEVTGKTTTDFWVTGSGENHFFVCVPADAKYMHSYGYNVKPDDSPFLDPVVRIVH
jgi:hypothetical protein